MFSVRGIRLHFFALALALIALAAGIYFTFFQGRGYVETKATIVSIVEKEIDTDHEKDYDVTVRFTVDGKEYSGLLNQYSPSYDVGDQVDVRYNPADPSDFHGVALGFSIYLMVIGVAMIAFVVVTLVREKQAQKRLEQNRDARNDVTYEPSAPGPERALYFLTDLGTAKYGHRIEDRNRRVLYEAKMTKFNAVQPFGFDFIDHEHNRTTPHLIGHDESTEWDNSLLFDNHYTFTFDGEYIWKHLKRNGIAVDSKLAHGATLLGHSFQVFRDGNLIATVENTSQYVHEEDAAQHGKLANAIPARGFYRIRTTETNLDLLFVTILAFARTQATSDNGGNRRTLFNTMKG